MVKKWEIYFLRFSPISGSEQAGIRPAIVVSNNAVNQHLPVFTVLPLSSVSPNDRIFPTEVLLETYETGLPKKSVAMVHQIRTVSAHRLVSSEKAGEISNSTVKREIEHAMRMYFEL